MKQLELPLDPPAGFAWNDVKYPNGADDPLFNLGDGEWMTRSRILKMIEELTS